MPNIDELAAKINDISKKDYKKFKEIIQKLHSDAKSGNEKSKELLGKIGEDAARQRRDYEDLQEAVTMVPIAGASIIGPIASTVKTV